MQIHNIRFDPQNVKKFLKTLKADTVFKKQQKCMKMYNSQSDVEY